MFIPLYFLNRKLLFAISNFQKKRQLYSDLSFYLKKSWSHFIRFSLVNNVQKTLETWVEFVCLLWKLRINPLRFCISLKPDEKITADI